MLASSPSQSVEAVGSGTSTALGAADPAKVLAGKSSASISPLSFAGRGAGQSTPSAGRSDSATGVASTKPIGPDPGPGRVRLPGHVLAALDTARRIDPRNTSDDPRTSGLEQSPLTLTLTLRRDDPGAFDRYLADVYDSKSKRYQKFLTQSQITERYGPSQNVYHEVLEYLRLHGLRLIAGSKNRLTLTVRGTRRDIEQAFAVHILDFESSRKRYFANDVDPAVPVELAPHIQAIVGLLTPPEPQPAGLGEAFINELNAIWKQISAIDLDAANAFAASSGNGNAITAEYGAKVSQACDALLELLPDALTGIAVVEDQLHHAFSQQSGASQPSGSASPSSNPQKIGVIASSAFQMSDVANWLTLSNLPANLLNQVSQVNVNGGAPIGPGETDALLAIATILNLDPLAKIAVYEAPFAANATSFQAVLNQMMNDGVTVVSNSNIYCEDETTLADVQSLDAMLASAAASGISVLSATGDAGSTCSDGSANTIAVPTDSPHVTAVGGSSGVIGPGNIATSQSWLNGSGQIPPTGQGGFGISKFFPQPAYQATLNLSPMRSVPDVVAIADPQFGPALCQADAGGCPTNLLSGGTSFSTPIWAAFVALLNQVSGKPLGLLNSSLYSSAAAATFHSPSSMGSDAAHVGLGSPNLARLYLALSGTVVGPVSAAQSTVTPSAIPLVQFLGSVPADGKTSAYVTVRLTDVSGFAVSGKTVALASGSGTAILTPVNAVTNVDDGAAVFGVTDTTPEALTFTATDATEGIVVTQTAAVTFAAPPAVSGGISAAPLTVAGDGQTQATIVVTLKNAQNQPSSGKMVTISDGGAHAVITAPTAASTDANGQIQFLVTDQVDESVTFTAIDVSDNLAIPGSATVTYSGSTNTACGVGVVPVAGTGYVITPFITGLPGAPNLYYEGVNLGCPGGNTPTFTPNGSVLVTDGLNGALYQLGLSGGVASTSNLLNTISPSVRNPVYGKDGNVYVTIGGEGGEIAQIDPTTGATVRVVASGLTCPGGLSVDPLSGDLFFDDGCTGSGTNNASVYRIIDPTNSNPSSPTSVVVYATLPLTPNGGMAFAPNGTLYAVSGYYVTGYPTTEPAEVVQISPTNSATVTVVPLSGLTSDYSVGIGVANPDGSAQSLIVEPSGILTEVPIATPDAASVLASVPSGDEVTGPAGVGATGPDGCLYFAHYDTIYRLSNTVGGCKYSPTSPAPSIYLTPATISPNPQQGAAQTFTVTLRNVSPLSGVPVLFEIAGVNTQLKLVNTDANGDASMTYLGAFAGADTVFATAPTVTNGTPLMSNLVNVTWIPGPHATFLTLNSSPTSATIGQPTAVVASLADIVSQPAAALPGQSIAFTLAGSTCTATTNSTGNATCTLTPTLVGEGTLTASFAGNSQFLASTGSTDFNVLAVPVPPPTVTIAVNPTAVAAGATTTLTWSSSNATACTASGAWSGPEATSGTQAVTPPNTGSYSYTLTCTGTSGSASATAVLSATLVAVTVSAHAGGGALTWQWLVLLGALLVLRLRTMKRVSGILIVLLFVIASGVTRADQPGAQTATGDARDSWLDPFYVGIRAGSMSTRLNSGFIESALAADGYPGIQANTGTSKPAGTVYVGYEVASHVDVEFGYTHRSANVATLNGTVGSTASIPPLLQDTAALIRSYGNVFALSFRPRIELVPNFMLDPRIGGFYWDTKVTAQSSGDRFAEDHGGGGVTLGGGVAYRVWRGLEIGAGADFFRGYPHNLGTLYSGTLEWRFGR